MFITKRGKSCFKDAPDSPVSKEFKKVMDAAEIVNFGVGFYALRNTFQTYGDFTDLPIAVKYIMGHCKEGKDMSAVYREAINDESLRKVTDFIRKTFEIEALWAEINNSQLAEKEGSLAG